ncbi:MAG: peptidylprolyl isomerase [Victivallaceae bacterium]|nr:peptidylprolyl isomerase [Victivallaceae bacterium]
MSKVKFTTAKGEIVIELFDDAAPETVKNFLAYVDSGFYDNTIFHRVIDNFMIQGGGFDTSFNQKPVNPPIANEADNRLPNSRGSIAMARTSAPHSASSQFFINVKDNDFLNFSAPTVNGYGYCVFGRVVEGMDAVDAIKSVATGVFRGYGDVPKEMVVIRKAERVE